MALTASLFDEDDAPLDVDALHQIAVAVARAPSKARKPTLDTLTAGVLTLIEQTRRHESAREAERAEWAREITTAITNLQASDRAHRQTLHLLEQVRVEATAAAHDLKCSSLIGGPCRCWKASLTALLTPQDPHV